MVNGIQIAIDGPAGAGKSTVAKMAAEKLGFTYIDTGAMYRALTHKALIDHIDINDEDAMKRLLLHTDIHLLPSAKGQAVLLDGEDVSEAIRTQEVTKAVSAVAAHPSVRLLMVDKQRQLATNKGVVMDGRDIGTDVLPEAQLKIFLTASVEERALRRFKENDGRGIHTSLEQLQADISERDRADSERKASPLRQAEDAILIDSTSMAIGDVVEKIRELAEERMVR
ncbi:cytidylate kinase [Bacillus sp. OxB-1]|uniref:(d)CMP kinase n=1 Tax=Bacillus sp. (strain OxB-1) TaxID=98228 RepID=UPI000581E3F0|nr:(d)CMP kinase [Bacillus sp. OxB-1]BAQ10799.1 cytidylate kinase [Bacillus sp. OxB-1]